MSISSAPSSTANLVSANFTARVDCPDGKAVETDATFTDVPKSAVLAVLTIDGKTHTAATVGKLGYESCR